MAKSLPFATRFAPPPSPSVEFTKASLTRQEFAAEADINNIMKRYAAGMPLPSGSRAPMYGDYSEVPDYQQAFDIVSHAQDGFMALPSELRKRFGNDPAQLISFLSDASNREEAIALGLIDKPAEVKPAEVSVPDEKSGEGK